MIYSWATTQVTVLSLTRVLTRAAALVQKLKGKGKIAEADAVLQRFYDEGAPEATLFSGAAAARVSLDRGSQPAAEGVRPAVSERETQWHKVIDES